MSVPLRSNNNDIEHQHQRVGEGGAAADELDYDSEKEQQQFNEAMLEWEKANPDRVSRENSPYYRGYSRTRFGFLQSNNNNTDKEEVS